MHTIGLLLILEHIIAYAIGSNALELGYTKHANCNYTGSDEKHGSSTCIYKPQAMQLISTHIPYKKDTYIDSHFVLAPILHADAINALEESGP